MINSSLNYLKSHLDGQILASEASRLQIGAANCNQRGAAQNNVSPLPKMIGQKFGLIARPNGPWSDQQNFLGNVPEK